MAAEDSDVSSRVRPSAEQMVILIFLVLSAYAFYEALSFQWESAIFPMITAAIVIIGCLMLLFRNYLPTVFEDLVSDEVQMMPSEADEDLVEAADTIGDKEDDVADETDDEAPLNRPLSGTAATIALSTLYVIASYAVGILWMTPLFALVYTIWFRQPWPVIFIVTVLSGGAAYAFMSLLNLSIDSGELIGVMVGVGW